MIGKVRAVNFMLKMCLPSMNVKVSLQIQVKIARSSISVVIPTLHECFFL